MSAHDLKNYRSNMSKESHAGYFASVLCQRDYANETLVKLIFKWHVKAEMQHYFNKISAIFH